VSFTIAFYVHSVPLTPAHLAGTASLGGSESACLGLARALARAGHRVHIHAQRLDPAAVGPDTEGVIWHDAGPHDEALRQWCEVVEPDVFVSLRMGHVFAQPLRARLRLQWNQDMLVGEAGIRGTLATSWQVDRHVYVSAYQQQQWETAAPDLAGHGWVTRNGYDPAHVPTDVATVPGRLCYVTRPERGLAPLLEMWPAVKAAVPHAELHITRYASMYDGEGSAVAQMCAAYDAQVARVQAAVGGIVVYPGGLGKADLYRLIASSAAMWYPGVHDFAETSCIAAIEAQACGTPFVGSAKGALPETVPHGVLLRGDARTAAYQRESIAAVLDLLAHGAEARIAAGRAHVAAYTYDAIAAEWVRFLAETFGHRYETQTRGVLRQLLQYDDHVPARQVAEDLGDAEALAFCARIILGRDMTAEHYGAYAVKDVLQEAGDGRFLEVSPRFADCTRVLDVAGGNGACAIRLALDHPAIRVHVLDYAAENIARGQAAALEAGVADRITFEQLTVWDFDTAACTPAFVSFCAGAEGFDGVFIGEFAEHIVDPAGLAAVTATATTGTARWIWTMPHGPFTELMPYGAEIHRGHVHHYAHDDMLRIFGGQREMTLTSLTLPHRTARGNAVAHWLVSYRGSAEPLSARDLPHRIVTTRPMPTLTVGLICHNAALDLPRCLSTVQRIADELIVADCGSTDETAAIARKHGARVLTLPPVGDLPEGFAEARNRVLAEATGDWFLWIDADEQLLGSAALRPYLESVTLAGVTLRQVHLQIDAPVHADTPVRVFRRLPGVRFWGAVHEQPQAGDDPNRDIWPSLAIDDVQIAHYGYLVDGVRRRKSQERNLPLLVRDRLLGHGRTLSHVLWMREYATWASQWRVGHYGQAMDRLCGDIGAERTQTACFPGAPRLPRLREELADYAATYYEAHFPDPTSALAKLARPFYEDCLRLLPGSWEIELAFAGAQGGMQQRSARAARAWVRSFADAEALFAMQTAALRAQFEPAPLQVDPVVEPAAAPAAAARAREAVPA
jgi:glycosyltransferase involved in cell wall biosynthesis/2-polyprenyl-3-methyl-5-hydroxy-6-metoxy-1,4-benzoquinol methylase